MIVQCQVCGIDLETPADSIGRNLQCPECGGVFVCPAPAAIIVAEPIEGLPPPPPLPRPIGRPAEPPGPSPPAGAPAEAADAEPTAPADALAGMAHAQPPAPPKPNPRQWQVIVGGVPAVALTYEELCEKAAGGQIKPRTRLHYVPKDLTVQARDVPGLFPQLDAERTEAPARAGLAARMGAAMLPKAPGRTGETPEAGELADALDMMGADTDRPADPTDSAESALEDLGKAAEEDPPQR